MTDELEALELETLEVETRLVEADIVAFTPEQTASRQRAHDMKVVKMLAGGKF